MATQLIFKDLFWGGADMESQLSSMGRESPSLHCFRWGKLWVPKKKYFAPEGRLVSMGRKDVEIISNKQNVSRLNLVKKFVFFLVYVEFFFFLKDV